MENCSGKKSKINGSANYLIANNDSYESSNKSFQKNCCSRTL